MGIRSEHGFVERTLIAEEWDQVSGAFKWGLGYIGAKALRTSNGCLKQEYFGYDILAIRAAMNQKFRTLKMPFKVTFRYDRKVWDRGFGRSHVWRYINPRILLMCRKKKETIGV